MTHPKAKPSLTWYDIYDEDHRSQHRREWYSSVAAAYRWARPHYPEAMLERVIAQANLSPLPKSILEIGCGPGIATTALARKGLHITAIEPSQGACAVAREDCRAYDHVTIINSTFEDFNLDSRAKQYDAVLAATSFHWVSPDIACQKSAAALNPQGTLILLWATPPQPSPEVSRHLQPVYEQYDLAELGQEQCRTQDYYQGNFETFAQTVNQSGFYTPSPVEIETFHSRYSIKKYLALLSTLSGYIGLDAAKRDNLLADLGQALASYLGDQPLETTHWFGAQVSPLIQSADASHD